jgi:TRAP-type C4-dicarboxylate transport system permease small subunit
MGGIRPAVAAVDRVVLQAENLVVGVLVGAMSVIIFAQVVFRYLLGSPLVWSEELARYLFVWVTMIGAAVAVRLGQHYGLDILTKGLPDRLKALVSFLASAIIAIVAASLIWHGVKEAVGAMNHVASSLEMRMVWFYAAIPIGGALMLWHVFARMAVLGIGVSPLMAHTGLHLPQPPD